MSLLLLAQLINIIANVLTILVFVWVIASWILAPAHPIREALDRVVEPLLAPIRRILPTTGSIDFSPIVLIIVIAVAAQILTSLIMNLG
jgi:YggT family protein